MNNQPPEDDEVEDPKATAPVEDLENVEYPKLTRRQARFVEHYLTFFHNRRAAVAAGYSERITTNEAWRIRKNPSVSLAIRLRLKERQISSDVLLARLSDQALARYSDYLNPDGSVDLNRLLADGQGHLIKKMRQTKEGTIEVEWHDAQAALVHLSRIHGNTAQEVVQAASGDVTFKVVWAGGQPGVSVTASAKETVE